MLPCLYKTRQGLFELFRLLHTPHFFFLNVVDKRSSLPPLYPRLPHSLLLISYQLLSSKELDLDSNIVI